jgi:hypothetical protein
MRRKYENNDSIRQKIKKSSLSAKISSRIDHWKQSKQNESVIEDGLEEIAITTAHGDFILTPLKGKFKLCVDPNYTIRIHTKSKKQHEVTFHSNLVWFIFGFRYVFFR